MGGETFSKSRAGVAAAAHVAASASIDASLTTQARAPHERGRSAQLQPGRSRPQSSRRVRLPDLTCTLSSRRLLPSAEAAAADVLDTALFVRPGAPRAFSVPAPAQGAVQSALEPLALSFRPGRYNAHFQTLRGLELVLPPLSLPTTNRAGDSRIGLGNGEEQMQSGRAFLTALQSHIDFTAPAEVHRLLVLASESTTGQASVVDQRRQLLQTHAEKALQLSRL
jgi:hypothetical protein